MREVPKDLGQRILAAARLAQLLHLKSAWFEPRPIASTDRSNGVDRRDARGDQQPQGESEAA